MKYYKYIIILILLLICALLYMQLDDYDNISNSLLSDNIKTKEKIQKLLNSIDDMKEYSLKLQQKINTLYSIIDAKEIEIELLEDSCIENNKTLDTPVDTLTPNNEISKTQNITLENENEVTGF